MGITMQEIYGGSGPLGSPTPSPITEDADFTRPVAMGPAGLVIAAILLLIAIRWLYELAD